MSEDMKYDDVFMNVLREQGQLKEFLDSIFGFLYRRTDFYIVQDHPSAKVGFPPGCAEQITRDTFRKWQRLANSATQNSDLSPMKTDLADLVIREEEVVTTDSSTNMLHEPCNKQPKQKTHRSDDLSSDTYNGADCGNYRWSQSSFEIDIKIPVPDSIKKSKSVKVDVQSSHLTVRVQDINCQWNTLVDGELSYKHQKEESIWTLTPGKQINVHLQKADERWWDSLFLTEPKLDMSKVNMSRHVVDLPEEDKMQVEKVMLQEERKRLGLPSIGHEKNLAMLEKAWNQEGSPFQGTPFDPSVLEISSE